MPIYCYKCGECGSEVERLHSSTDILPVCCGKAMTKMPTIPALITMVDKGRIPMRSKGYKEGYSKEYLRSIGKA